MTWEGCRLVEGKEGQHIAQNMLRLYVIKNLDGVGLISADNQHPLKERGYA